MLDSKRNLQILSTVLFLICLFLFFAVITVNKKNLNKIVHDSNNAFLFTNPILDCEGNVSSDEASISRKDVGEKIDYLKEKYNISFISFYFRDLNNGPWIGVNEKEEFVPASLLKVPLAISLFRYGQDTPEIFNKRVILTEKNIKESYPQTALSAPIQMQQDEEYSMLEVAERTIKYSDNLGVNLIVENVPKKYLEDLYLTIGGSGIDSNVRVKDYASFFRILYNSSYLSRDLSEKLLGILSDTSYKEGIVAGVPENIKVAHKFGEFTVDEAFDGGLALSTTEVQTHDCGIIYHPSKPYLLCIMTRGTDFIEQQNAIKELSRFVYQEID